jgi:luciferase family oxidoreductase group 1
MVARPVAAYVSAMVPLSVLDLAPIVEGGDVRQALQNTAELARRAEAWGYRRIWFAEHHNMPAVASAATALVIGHAAAATSRIRVGAGGIMLPNHAPLVIAEQFGTLEALHPGRIDLGVGRAPGTDHATARALRRNLQRNADGFPGDVIELISYLRAPAGGTSVRAIPGAGSNVPVWILGSSLYGAQLAAALGLPYAFASHFAPAALVPALELYRSLFRPSPELDRPYVMLGVNVIAADSDAEAALLRTSLEQVFVQLRRGRPGPLPPPRAGFGDELTAEERAGLNETLACCFAGSPATVRPALDAFAARHGADELIVASHIHDHEARLRSYALTAQAATLAA